MRKKELIVLVSVILIAFIFHFFTDGFTKVNVDNYLKVHFIDVGQGDSAFVVLPEGKTMLIDAGENSKGNEVVEYIENIGVKKIDFVVGTHPHSDHIGGLDVVIDNFQIGEVYMPFVSSTTKTYEDVLNSVSAKNLKIKKAKKGKVIYSNDETLIELIGPNEIDEDNLNNSSAIVKLTHKDKVFLFMADAETEAEDMLENVDADVLKVGHHGSSTSSSERFIKKVSPELAIISVGKNNDYGHPHKEVKALFEELSVKTYRTDECGTVIVKTDGKEVVVETEK